MTRLGALLHAVTVAVALSYVLLGVVDLSAARSIALVYGGVMLSLGVANLVSERRGRHGR